MKALTYISITKTQAYTAELSGMSYDYTKHTMLSSNNDTYTRKTYSFINGYTLVDTNLTSDSNGDTHYDVHNLEVHYDNQVIAEYDTNDINFINELKIKLTRGEIL